MKNKALQQYIKTFVDKSASALKPYILQGNFNNEFIRGRQNRRINSSSLSIEDKPRDAQVYTERKVYNRMLPIYLTRYGILSQNMPIPGIEPQESSTKMVADSIKVNKFLLSIMTDNNFKSIYKKAIKHADVYGIVWIKTGIDWTDGDTICTVDTSIGDQKGTVTIKEGRPFISAIPIQEIFVDSYYAESMDDINELVHRRVFPLDYIKNRWGVDAEPERIDDIKLSSYPKYDVFGTSTVSDIKYAYVYEYYKKPDAIYPEGRYTVMCSDNIIWDDVLPYKNSVDGTRVIPFDFFNMQSLPHYLVGVTVYSQLIPIQETFNAIKNRYLEYVNHIAIGQLYVWDNSLVNEKGFTTKPGKLIRLKRNSRPPQIVAKDKLSNEFLGFLSQLQDDMLITAGLSQMSAFGSSKASIRTDGIVDKLTESDDNKLNNALDNISECIISIAKKVVYLEKERVKTLSEQLKVAKTDRYADTYRLADVDAEQITIVNREFLMQSDAAYDKKLQQASMLGLYAFDSPLSYQSKVEFLNAMHANFLKDTLNPEERATHDLCVEENYILLDSGKVPQAEPYHVHQQHLQEHNLFRISPEVRQLKKENDGRYIALQEAITQHIQMHEKLVSDSMQKQGAYRAKETLSTAGKKFPRQG